MKTAWNSHRDSGRFHGFRKENRRQKVIPIERVFIPTLAKNTVNLQKKIDSDFEESFSIVIGRFADFYAQIQQVTKNGDAKNTVKLQKLSHQSKGQKGQRIS